MTYHRIPCRTLSPRYDLASSTASRSSALLRGAPGAPAATAATEATEATAPAASEQRGMGTQHVKAATKIISCKIISCKILDLRRLKQRGWLLNMSN